MTKGKSGFVTTGEVYQSWHVNEGKLLWLTAAAAATTGDVLVLDTSGQAQAKATTTEGALEPVCVVALDDPGATQGIATGVEGWFQAWGRCAKVNLMSAATTGDWLVTSTTSLKAKPVTSGTLPPTGAFGRVLTTGSTPEAHLFGGVYSRDIDTAATLTWTAVHTFTASHLAANEVRAAASYGLKLYNAAGTAGIFVKDDGQVGIGTTSPGAKLGVYTTDWTDYLPLVNITNLDANAIQSYALLLRGGANNLVGLTFQVQDFDGNTDFVITGDGRVGIGTTTPFQKLTLEHGHYIAWPTAAITTSRSWGIRNDLDNFGDFSIRSSDANDNTLDTTRLVIDKDGNLGIGTTTPAHLLDVAGNIGLAASGYIYWSGATGASGYGFYDNAGALQYKHSGGAWANVVAITAGSWMEQSGAAATVMLNVQESSLDHDALTNYVANEHIDHTGVTLTAGSYLTGGGDLSANRRFDFDHPTLGTLLAGTFYTEAEVDTFVALAASKSLTLTAGSYLSGGGDLTTDRRFDFDHAALGTLLAGTFYTETEVDAFVILAASRSITLTAGSALVGGGDLTADRSFAVDGTLIDHDTLSGSVANEHIDHTGVTLTAGSFMSGGGTIAANRRFDFDHAALGTLLAATFYTESEVDTFVALAASKSITLTAGSYLSGGGDLTADQRFDFDHAALGTLLAGSFYTETEIDTFVALAASKSLTLTGGTGIAAIGDLTADRTINVDTAATLIWTGVHTFTASHLAANEVRAAASYGLKLYNAAGTAGIFVNDVGNVGIGTTSQPAWAKLDVYGTIRQVGRSDTPGGGGINYGGVTMIRGTTTGNHQAFDTFDTTWSERMRITSGGNVGIGTTAPSTTLHAAGVITAATNIDVHGNIGLAASHYINWGDTDGDSGYGFYDNAGTMQFKDSGGAWVDISTAASGVPGSRILAAGSFMSGGGDLTADRRFDFDHVPLGTLLAGSFYTETEVDTFVALAASKSLTLTGGTGIAAIGDLTADRTITVATPTVWTTGLASDNDIIRWDSASGTWQPEAGGGAAALDDLSDVDSATQTDGFVIKSGGGNYAGGQLSHTKLGDVGTKTHAQIETQMNLAASKSITLTAGSHLAGGGDLTTDRRFDVTAGISDTNVVKVDGSPSDNEYAKFTAAGLEGRSYADVLSDLSGEAAAEFLFNTQKVGGVVDPTTDQQVATKKYVDDNVVASGVDTSGVPVDDDWARFTDADTIEGLSDAETKTALALNNVENVALSGVTLTAGSYLTGGGTIETSQRFDFNNADDFVWAGAHSFTGTGIALTGATRQITFDTNDRLAYVGDTYFHFIDNTSHLTIDADLLTIYNTNGIALTGTNRRVRFSADDYLQYDISNDWWDFIVGSTERVVISASGFSDPDQSHYVHFDGNDLVFKDVNTAEKTLTELAAGGGASDLADLSDVDAAVQTDGFVVHSDGGNYEGAYPTHLDDVAMVGTNRRITFDTNDYLQYDRANDEWEFLGNGNISFGATLGTPSVAIGWDQGRANAAIGAELTGNDYNANTVLAVKLRTADLPSGLATPGYFVHGIHVRVEASGYASNPAGQYGNPDGVHVYTWACGAQETALFSGEALHYGAYGGAGGATGACMGVEVHARDEGSQQVGSVIGVQSEVRHNVAAVTGLYTGYAYVAVNAGTYKANAAYMISPDGADPGWNYLIDLASGHAATGYIRFGANDYMTWDGSDYKWYINDNEALRISNGVISINPGKGITSSDIRFFDSGVADWAAIRFDNGGLFWTVDSGGSWTQFT